MRTWISVNDKPVCIDCDVIICFRAGFFPSKLVVALARAWSHYEYWRGKPSFFRWPDRELIPYSEITHWMPFEGLPEPPAGKKEA